MRKKILWLLTLVFLFMVLPSSASAFSARTTVPSGNYWYDNSYNPYYSRYTGQCTWYVWGRAYEITGTKPTYDPVYGGGVYDACVTAGYSYGSTPKVGSIMCTDTHVAVVEAINGDSMTLSEYNWAIKEGFSTDTLSVSASSTGSYRSGQRILGYIYLGNFDDSISLQTDKERYSLGDSVNISINPSGECNIEIYCNSDIEFSGKVGSRYSYTPTRAGRYTIKASSNSGYSNETVFDVGIGSRSVSGDFNGDGYDDYATLYDLGKGKSQWHVFLSTGSTFSEEIWWTENNEGWYSAACVSGRVVSGDFNGDGMDDIAVMHEYEKYKNSIHVFLSEGNSFSNWQTWLSQTQYQAYLTSDRFVAGDFNGDGYDDIACMYEYEKYKNSIHVYLSTGKSFSSWQQWLSQTQYEAYRTTGRFVAGDFNGDGYDDIACMYEYDKHKNSIHVYLSTGKSFSSWQQWLSQTQYEASKTTGRFVAGDFNGDGYDDIACMYEYEKYKNLIHVYLSTGKSFSSWQNWLGQTQYEASKTTGRFVAGDFNGDGMDDVAVVYSYDGTRAAVHMYKSVKSIFSLDWWINISAYDARRTTGTTAYTDDYKPTFVLLKEDLSLPKYAYQINRLIYKNGAVKISLKNNYGTNGTIILSTYANDNHIGVVVSDNISAAIGTADEISFNIENNNISYVQVFIWDGLDKMKPLSCKKRLFLSQS